MDDRDEEGEAERKDTEKEEEPKMAEAADSTQVSVTVKLIGHR